MGDNQDNRSTGNTQNYSSWVLRAKYSPTVCYRLDPLAKSSFPISREVLVPKPTTSGSIKLAPSSEDRKSPFSKSGSTEFSFSNLKSFSRRYPSPEPHSAVSETFREAKSKSKRFLSPQRKPLDNIRNKTSSMARHYNRGRKLKDSSTRTPTSTPPSSPMLSFFSPTKSPDFIHKDSQHKYSWSRYVEQSGDSMTAVESAQEWMVDLSKLFLGQKFAVGAHSRLYHGIYNEKPVAVKVIRQPDGDENEVLASRLEKQFNREVTTLSRLHHRNIVQLVAACISPPVFCVITEYLSGGSLRSFLHRREPGSVCLKEFLSMALHIARGMEYLHSQGVIHRDLKSENLLFTGDMCLKIVDFGIACEEVNCDYLNEDPGTYRWMAPEMISHKPYNRKVDVYSFGIVLWEIATGRVPYEDMTPVQAAFAVVHKNARPTLPEDCPLAMRKLIDNCWAQNPEKRPDFWYIVKILEQFEAALLHDGSLTLCQILCFNEQRNRLPQWFQRLGIGNPRNAISP
ncbi:hypothetical protein KI387_016964, partial [Taxus chinensis]